MAKLENVHDNYFKSMFKKRENVRDFLSASLPDKITKYIDFNKIEIDDSGYISNEVKGYFSDIVVRTRIKGKRKGEKTPIDVYILFEHKSYQDKNIYFQLLRYMYLMWQQDMREGRKLRVIVPFVFYHGRSRWKLSRDFRDVFEVDDDMKEYLMNYRYVLFDTNDDDMFKRVSEKIRNNIILLGEMLLMKDIYRFNKKILEKVLDVLMRVESEEELMGELIKVLNYVVIATEIKEEDMIEILNNKKIKGGDEIMPTLARKWYEEGIQEGIEKGMEKGMEKGIYEDKKMVAKNMLMMGMDIAVIVKATGLSEKEVNEIRKEIKKN